MNKQQNTASEAGRSFSSLISKRTKTELARLLGISRMQLHRIETGKRYPTDAVFAQLVEVLGVSARRLRQALKSDRLPPEEK